MTKLPRLVPLALVSSLAFVAPMTALPQTSYAQAIVASITIAPPALPVYVQPPMPAVGYLWTPGYWAYGPDGYYWVPGTWIMPPSVGLLWTPGYWGWVNGGYFWHAGYWGPHIGFYGGINYGFGYFGVGFLGGHWDGGHFFYNHAVNNFGNVHVTNVYNQNVTNVTVNHTSFNGGSGGIQARPTAEEQAAANDHHIEATAEQQQHEHTAASDHNQLASVNHGHPDVAATARPAAFTGAGVEHSRGAPAGGQPQHQAGQPGGAPHPQNNAAQHPQNNAARGSQPQHQGPVHNAAAPHGVQPHPAAHPAQRPVHPANAHPAAHPAPHPQPHPQGGNHDQHP